MRRKLDRVVVVVSKSDSANSACGSGMGGHGRGKGAAIMRPVFRLADRIFFGVPFGVPTFNTLRVRRLGAMMVEGTDVSMAEKDRTKLTEEGALKGLGKIVGKHVLGGTVHNVDVAPLAVVGNKEITDVDVSGALATGGLAVALHLDGALVVLVKNSGFNGVALCLHEHLDIQGVREVIAGPDEFGLGRAFAVEALLPGLADNATAAKGNDPASVAAHVRVDGEGGVDPRHKFVEGIGAETQGQGFSPT